MKAEIQNFNSTQGGNMDSLKNKLGRQPVLGVISNIYSSELVEYLGYRGFDYFVIDLEHAPISFEKIAHIIRAGLLAGISVLVRPFSNNNLSVYLDLGAEGFMIPNVESVEVVKYIVDDCLYPPLGKRGIGANFSNRQGMIKDFGSYQEESNAAFFLIPQIESLKGVEIASQISKMSFVNGIIVGSRDLANSMGHKGDYNHFEVKKTIEKIKTNVINNKGTYCYLVRDPYVDIPQEKNPFLLISIQSVLNYGSQSFLKLKNQQS